MDNEKIVDVLKKIKILGFDGQPFKNCVESIALDYAISAIEKQTPKKPKMRHVKWYDGYSDGWCPCCESYVQETLYDTRFCQMCGQALNWEE